MGGRRRPSGNSELTAATGRDKANATHVSICLPACAYTRRMPSDSLIDSQWWGFGQGDVGARGLGWGRWRRRRRMGSKQLPATPQQQAIDLLCTYGRRMRAESHCCCEGGGRGVGHAAWSRARRPFSLAGWGLHLASNGINNPNHHIGPVWAGRTPPRRTVSIIPGASEPCPQSCHARLIDMDPYRAHVVARMLMACFSASPDTQASYISNKHQSYIRPRKRQTTSIYKPCHSLQ